MDETNFDWDDLRLFLAVARAGGLSPAAATTGKSAATLGRRLLKLEAAIGQELVLREARGYLLTEQGQALLEHAEKLEAKIHSITRREGAAQKPLVKISAGSWMARYLAQNAVQLVTPDDQVRLRIESAEHRSDIGHREAVIGIRNMRPTEPSLAAQKIANVHFAVYAADTSIQHWIHARVDTPSAHWVQRNHASQVAIEVNAPALALEFALAGAGRLVLPERIGDAETGLVRCSGTIDALSQDQWLVSHHEDRNQPHVRLILNRIAALLKV